MGSSENFVLLLVACGVVYPGYVLAHELSHVIVGVLLRFRFISFSIGHGASLSRREVGGVRFHLRLRWMEGASVGLVTDRPGCYRTRSIALLLAGSVGPVVLAIWLHQSLAPAQRFADALLDSAVLVAVVLGCHSLWPGGDEEPNDGQLIREALRLTSEDVETLCKAAKWQASLEVVDEILAEGHQSEFEQRAPELCAAHPDTWFESYVETMLALIAGDLSGAVEKAEEAAERASLSEGAWVRAFTTANVARALALVGEPATLDRARDLAAEAGDDEAVGQVDVRRGDFESAWEHLKDRPELRWPLTESLRRFFLVLAALGRRDLPSALSHARQIDRSLVAAPLMEELQVTMGAAVAVVYTGSDEGRPPIDPTLTWALVGWIDDAVSPEVRAATYVEQGGNLDELADELVRFRRLLVT